MRQLAIEPIQDVVEDLLKPAKYRTVTSAIGNSRVEVQQLAYLGIYQTKRSKPGKVVGFCIRTLIHLEQEIPQRFSLCLGFRRCSSPITFVELAGILQASVCLTIQLGQLVVSH